MNSTFLTGVDIYNKKVISNCLTFDSSLLHNYSNVDRVRIMSYVWVTNRGNLYNSSFGSRAVNTGLPQFAEIIVEDGCRIINSMIGGNYLTGFRLVDCAISSSFIHFGIAFNSNLTMKGHLTAFRDGNIDVSLNTNFTNTTFNINTGFLKNPNKVNSYGYNYVFTASNIYSDKVIDTMSNKNLYYSNITSSGVSFVTASIPN